MKYKSLQWLGLALILVLGIIHFLMAPVVYELAPYLGVLFGFYSLAAMLAALGILRGKTWGWVLGVLISVGSAAGYVWSRSLGLPGMQAADWFQPFGILSLSLEVIFIALVLILSRRTTLLGSRFSGRSLAGIMTGVLLLSIGFLTIFQWYSQRSDPRMHNVVQITSQYLAQEYGLQVSLIGVTMMDSSIDLRFRVLDANKAARLLDDPTKKLVLIVENDENMIIQPVHLTRHQLMLNDGGVFNMFFPNVKNAIHSGTPVNLVFGDMKLGPLSAQ